MLEEMLESFELSNFKFLFSCLVIL
jgi:hypothetical protein